MALVRVLLCVLWLGLVPASLGYGGEHTAEEKGSVGELLYPAINFLVFAYVVRRYGWPAVRSYLEERQSRVVEEHARGKTAVEQAEARRAGAQERCAALSSEQDRLRQEIVGAAERFRDRLLQAAEQSARRILRDAELVQGQERRRAVQRVRAELAMASMREAEQLLAARISERDQERFRRLLLEEVARP